MTAKTIKVSKTKAFRIEAVEINGQKMISIRQMYATAKDPEFKPAKQGVTIPLGEDGELAVSVSSVIKRYATSDSTEFKVIEMKRDE